MFIIDCEVYRNYFLLAAKHIDSQELLIFEKHNKHPLDVAGVSRFMRQQTTISFNGFGYDLPVIVAALEGASCVQLKRLSDKIIKSKAPAWMVCRDESIIIPSDWDHIDLIEVTPGQSSLKIYGGRLNAPKMQDLPIHEADRINATTREQLIKYCVNDLDTTELLYRKLEKQITLRAEMGKQYGLDLRSKSDAQIAETVIKSELHKITGKDYRAPQLPADYNFNYKNPGFIDFKTEQIKAVFERLLSEKFELGANGSVIMPDWLRNNHIHIGQAKYQMGIGGLHSCESKQYVRAADDECLSDWDVASYYPSIILQQGLAPKSLGAPFLEVYESLVKRRLQAKSDGDKTTADTLKIAINGSFGKLGSKYSALFAPELLIQTTITGQLALLMLIERLELIGVRVVSANTDGIVIHHKKAMMRDVEHIMWDWMLDTSYALERTDYRCIASRDVNNYLAVKLDGTTKGKGCFAEPSLAKNPDQRIVYEAVADYVANGTPIEKTITQSNDVTKFVTVRNVKGGAVWRGEPVGKAVRFYYSTSAASDECIHYASNNNRVPNSAGAKPLMNLPDKLPTDIDYRAYIVAAEKLICEIGAHNAGA